MNNTIRHFSILALVFMLSGIPSITPASEFVLKDTLGHAHRLSDYKGKWVLVNFWATWCPPCMAEIPELLSLNDAHKNLDMVVISVAVNYRSSDEVTSFITKHGVTFPVVLGTTNTAEQLFVPVPEGLPTTYLFNQSGKPVGTQTGPVTRADIEAFMRCSVQHC